MSIAQGVLTYLVPPALAALLGGYLVHRWKGRGDYLEKRLDELCAYIDAAAEHAAQYWALPQSDAAALREQISVRAELMKVAGLRALIELTVSVASRNEIRAAESEFLRELTGGDFGVHNRLADQNRVIAVRHSAARFVVAVRTAHMRDLQGLRRRG